MLIYLLNNNCTWCKAGLNSEVSQAKNWKTPVMNWQSSIFVREDKPCINVRRYIEDIFDSILRPLLDRNLGMFD